MLQQRLPDFRVAVVVANGVAAKQTCRIIELLRSLLLLQRQPAAGRRANDRLLHHTQTRCSSGGRLQVANAAQSHPNCPASPADSSRRCRRERRTHCVSRAHRLRRGAARGKQQSLTAAGKLPIPCLSFSSIRWFALVRGQRKLQLQLQRKTEPLPCLTQRSHTLITQPLGPSQ